MAEWLNNKIDRRNSNAQKLNRLEIQREELQRHGIYYCGGGDCILVVFKYVALNFKMN